MNGFKPVHFLLMHRSTIQLPQLDFGTKITFDEAPLEIIKGTPPSKSNAYKIITIGKGDNSHSSLGKTKDLVLYEKAFVLQCRHYRNKEIGYFDFYMDVYYENNRSDLDGALKIILDCLGMRNPKKKGQNKCNAIQNDNKCMRSEELV